MDLIFVLYFLMKIASLNICGLKIRTKTVSDFIYKNHLDLIAIQEVHKIEKFEIQKFENDSKEQEVS